MLKRFIMVAAIGMPLLATGPVIAEAAAPPDKGICDATHCCVQFDTPNGGLVECYLREEQAPSAKDDDGQTISG